MMIRSRRTRPRSLPRSTDPTDAAALAARRAGRVLRGRDDPRRRAWHHPQRVGRTGLHLATVRIAGLASSGSEGASQSVRRGEGRASARADRRVAGRRARSRSRSTGPRASRRPRSRTRGLGRPGHRFDVASPSVPFRPFGREVVATSVSPSTPPVTVASAATAHAPPRLGRWCPSDPAAPPSRLHRPGPMCPRVGILTAIEPARRVTWGPRMLVGRHATRSSARRSPDPRHESMGNLPDVPVVAG